MGVAGKREGDAGRHVRKDIRLMHHEDHRVVGLHMGERTGQIVDAAELLGPTW